VPFDRVCRLRLALNVTRRQLTTDEQRDLVRRLRREFGWSYPMIERAMGIDQWTIARWCEEEQQCSGVSFETPEHATPPPKVLGLDGKRYPAERRDEDERATLVERATGIDEVTAMRWCGDNKAMCPGSSHEEPGHATTAPPAKTLGGYRSVSACAAAGSNTGSARGTSSSSKGRGTGSRTRPARKADSDSRAAFAG